MIFGIFSTDAENRFGYDQNLIYKCSYDMQIFKERTKNCVCFMGRKTFESLNMPNGLPGRENVVISATPSDNTDTVKYFSTLTSALLTYKNCGKDIAIIGGSFLLNEAMRMKICDMIYVTSFTRLEMKPKKFLFFNRKVKFPEYDSAFIIKAPPIREEYKLAIAEQAVPTDVRVYDPKSNKYLDAYCEVIINNYIREDN